jgi:hypothetical protein
MIRRSSLLSCVAGTWFIVSAHAAVPNSISEEEVLAGDWPAIARHLADVKSLDPVTIFIAGHAFLANDRANEAMCGFAAGTPAAARAAWRAWTTRLTATFPASGIAHYLEGDALARDAEWTSAQAAFDRALSLAPGNSPFVNARAVAAAGGGNWPAASADLLAAAGSLFDSIMKQYPNHVIGLLLLWERRQSVGRGGGNAR